MLGDAGKIIDPFLIFFTLCVAIAVEYWTISDA